MTRTLVTHSAEETQSVAAALGRLLEAGDVVCLVGELGAGKTTLTQGLALGLGLPGAEPVNSPTFTLVTEHRGGRVPLFHFDVYRLADSSGLYELAWDEYLDAGGVVVMEWANNVADALPPARLDILLEVDAADASRRRLTFTPHGPRAEALTEAVDTARGNPWTRKDWREIGFYYDYDKEQHLWLLTGSLAGLLTLRDTLNAYAANPTNRVLGEHQHLGPYFYFTLQTWDTADITERGILGQPADFARLVALLEQKLNAHRIGDVFTIRDEYAPNCDFTLQFTVQGNDFDPASADPLVN